MSIAHQKNAGGSGGAGTAPPAFLMVFCHGHGGNAEQLAALAANAARAFPQAAIFLPDAPTPCPFSLRGALSASRRRQWFPLSHPLPSRSPEAEEAAAWLNQQVDAELQRWGLAENVVWFVGFSQGAMVSLLAGLTRPLAPRGIIGIAGALLAPEGDFVPSCRPPVLLVHGAADSVVPAERSEDALRRLQGFGIDVRLALLPGLDHVIVSEAAPFVSAYIAESLR
jgi:phospholipase/carboxylesterase